MAKEVEQVKKDSSIKEFCKTAAIFVLSLVAIITSAGVWNAVYAGAIQSFYGWVAGANLVAEGFGIYKLVKAWFNKN